MPKQKGATNNSNHPPGSTFLRKLTPVKPFSKVKTVKMFPTFPHKKKNHPKRKQKRSSSNFLFDTRRTEFSPAFCNFSNSSWFWRNYEIAQRWQRAHMMSIEKANMAVSIFQRSLLQPLQQPILNSGAFRKPKTHFFTQRTVGCDIDLMGSLSSLETDTDRAVEDESDTCGPENECGLEFKVDENMRSFLEQSMRHKQEMQRLRDAEMEANVDSEMFDAPKESAMEERKKAMNVLYGDAAPKILSMEMALQMTFDRHFDQKQPAFWPNLPLLL